MGLLPVPSLLTCLLPAPARLVQYFPFLEHPVFLLTSRSDSPVALVWEAVFPLLPLSLPCLSLASQVGHS